jgi:hypothetical protein
MKTIDQLINNDIGIGMTDMGELGPAGSRYRAVVFGDSCPISCCMARRFKPASTR